MRLVPAAFRSCRKNVAGIHLYLQLSGMAVTILPRSIFINGSEPLFIRRPCSSIGFNAQPQVVADKRNFIIASFQQGASRSTGTGSTLQSQNRTAGEHATGRIRKGSDSAEKRVWGDDRRGPSSSTLARPSHSSAPPHKSSEAGWNQGDARAVREAINDAAHLAPSLSAQPSIERGNGILLGRSVEELEKLAVDLGEMKYRGRQLHQFLYKTKGVDLNDLQLLPKQFRIEMSDRGFSVGRMAVHHVVAAPDGTAKLLLRLDDSRVVEAVGIPSEGIDGKQRLTACVSSQVGCPLRCSFCATGKGGFSRNLRPHEIVGQVLALEELFKGRVSNVVFMGMGEPLLNLPAVTSALRCLNKELGIGQRMMTLSTVGVPNTIRKLAEQRLQVTLAISLHAPNQRLREQLVPSARAYPLEALLEDCVYYFKATGRRVSFEYTLLAAVNDQPEHAAELAALLQKWGLGRHVNIIPYNPVQDSEYRRPNKAYVMAFVDTLKRHNVTATIRQTRGMEANAACGQLRNEFQKVPLPI